jgi:hypothetical protein
LIWARKLDQYLSLACIHGGKEDQGLENQQKSRWWCELDGQQRFYRLGL